MLRFVTLIPVVLALAATLKFGAQDLDQLLSARPVARELATMEMHPLPLAVYHVRRELEYGLTFYRNHLTFNYDWGRVPQQEHLLVAPEGLQIEVANLFRSVASLISDTTKPSTSIISGLLPQNRNRTNGTKIECEGFLPASRCFLVVTCSPFASRRATH